MQDKNKNEGRRKRKPKGTADEVDAFAGPWAGYEGEESEDEEAALALANAGTVTGAIAAAEKAKEAQEEEDVSAQVSEDGPRQKKSDDYLYSAHEKSKFHGKAETDYMGRTYIHVPQDLDVDLTKEAGSQECFLPKKCLHTWTGHTKGVNTIKLFPKSGHLMLSGSQDTKIKLWDVYHDRKCLRTFMGHDKAIRDISFSNDGRRFLSASFDKWIKLWDTETGQCLGRYTTKRIPFCVTFNPDDDKQNIFLTGCQDKKIYQFDMNSGKVTQEYDQHLGGVNSVTFIDQGRRFISTSDDKTIRAWEYDIPVVVKYIADPSMHSMPATALSPNRNYFPLGSL